MLKVASAVGSIALLRGVIRARRKMDLTGKTVVITGGSRGLGLVLARTLGERGARVAICARDAAELERAKQELVRMGIDTFAMVCDVSDRDDVLKLIASVEDDFGAIDVLVNNAGIIQVGPLEAMTEDDFERAMKINWGGPLHAMMAVLPGMRKRKHGRIVNIASIGGKLAMPHLAPYAASKFALVGLSEAMRAECAKDNIYVTTVCPGLMRTGSPPFAWFKGHVKDEYAWFSIGDNSKLTSVSAESACAQIADALAAGDPELVISPQAKLAAFAHGLAPGFVQEVLGIVTRFLPPPTTSKIAVEGKDADLAQIHHDVMKQVRAPAFRR
ncbi:MAG: SDR family oxidoreductase [Kofleriaceae bacterium]